MKVIELALWKQNVLESLTTLVMMLYKSSTPKIKTVVGRSEDYPIEVFNRALESAAGYNNNEGSNKKL